MNKLNLENIAVMTATLAAVGINSISLSGCKQGCSEEAVGPVDTMTHMDAGKKFEPGKDDAGKPSAVVKGSDGQRIIPIKILDDQEGRCGEFEMRMLLGPESWRADRNDLDKIVKVFDHLHNNRNKDWRDRVELTDDEVAGCDYECLEACDSSTMAWLNDTVGQRCFRTGIVEKFRFKRKAVRQVEVSYHEGINSWGEVDVLAGEGREERNHVFRFRTEKEIDEFVRDLGPYEKETEWKNKEKERVVRYVRDGAVEPITHPKEEGSSNEYGRILFSVGEMKKGLTLLDRRVGGDCRPDEVLAFFKGRDEVERRHQECDVCSLKETVGSYNLMNDAEKSLCDSVILSKKELFCLLRECTYGCLGVKPNNFGSITCTGFIPKEQYRIRLSNIQKVSQGNFYVDRGYGSVTIAWIDQESKKSKKSLFVFRKENQMKRFTDDLGQYVRR